MNEKTGEKRYGTKPIETIRNAKPVVFGIMLFVLAAFIVVCFFVFGLSAKRGRLFLGIFFGISALLMAAAGAALLMNRIELYRDRFRQWNVGWESFSYDDCVSKYPVYEENPVTGKRRLYHVEFYFKDGSTVIVNEKELTKEFKRLLDYDALPVMSRRNER